MRVVLVAAGSLAACWPVGDLCAVRAEDSVRWYNQEASGGAEDRPRAARRVSETVQTVCVRVVTRVCDCVDVRGGPAGLSGPGRPQWAAVKVGVTKGESAVT